MFNKTISLSIALFTMILSGCALEPTKSDKKPNFLWILSEDNSKHFLHLYNDNGAKMPNVEKLAEQGLIFDNAFSNAPVCSTARTTLATGAYGPKIGTQFHRPSEKVNLPTNVKIFSQMLKDAGYYTTNNAKTDYNFNVPVNVWSDSSKNATWKNRLADQPFFHVQTWKDTHEHKLHFPASDINNVNTHHKVQADELFPIYPDTDLFKYTQARYLDAHQVIDAKVGDLVKQLEESGELENTFIFYFGDHGGVLPASKGHIHERGLQVPLIVRIPENFKHLLTQDMQSPENKRVSGFVSFIDFGPTILELAGLEKSSGHEGKAFLGKDVSLAELNARNTSFSYADRFDEKYDFARAIRQGKFKYVRNYLPQYPDALFAEYRYKQQAMVEWRELYKNGELNPTQSLFFEAKTAERLYDLEADPHETNDLSQDKEYQKILSVLRWQLTQKLKSMPDLSFYPESYLYQYGFKNPEVFAAEHKNEISNLIDIANMQYQDLSKIKSHITRVLNSTNPWQRYWAMMVLTSFGNKAESFIPQVQKLLKTEPNLLTQAKAVEFLTQNNVIDAQSELTEIIKKAKTDIEIVEILNVATYLHDVYGIKFYNPDPTAVTKITKKTSWVKRWIMSRWAHLKTDATLVKNVGI